MVVMNGLLQSNHAQYIFEYLWTENCEEFLKKIQNYIYFLIF